MDAYENGYPCLIISSGRNHFEFAAPPLSYVCAAVKVDGKFFDFAVATNGINARKKHRF